MTRPSIPPCPNGFHHLRGTHKIGECWTCDNKAKQLVCKHEAGRIPQWAGILGMNYYCGACGKRVDRDMN